MIMTVSVMFACKYLKEITEELWKPLSVLLLTLKIRIKYVFKLKIILKNIIL